jgi:4-carboxymuconolactone decarboxylase
MTGGTLAATGEEVAALEDEMFERGLQVRREVLGAQYVDASLEDASTFTIAFQRLLTEWAWGYVWSRPGLDRKRRSLLNLGILTALGRPDELAVYVRGAPATGCTMQEIQEVLLHATVYCYCGTPAGRQAFLAADAVLKAAGAVE